MFFIPIKDLKMQLSNSYPPIRKNAIYFEPLAQKREISKQMAGALDYKY